MPEIDRAYLVAQIDRVLKEQAALRADIDDFRADVEVTAAIVRRMDGTMQGLVGEVRSLVGQDRRCADPG